MVQYLALQKSSLTRQSTILAFDSMENQIPSLAVLSGKNMTLQDQVHFLYDFPFATILKQPFFQCILDEILQSLALHQLMQYAADVLHVCRFCLDKNGCHDSVTSHFSTLYKILYRICYTNSMLFKFGLADSPLCYFCNEELENYVSFKIKSEFRLILRSPLTWQE